MTLKDSMRKQYWGGVGSRYANNADCFSLGLIYCLFHIWGGSGQ